MSPTPSATPSPTLNPPGGGEDHKPRVPAGKNTIQTSVTLQHSIADLFWNVNVPIWNEIKSAILQDEQGQMP